MTIGPTTALIYAPDAHGRWRERVLRVEVLGGVRHLYLPPARWGRPVQTLVRVLVEGESAPRDIEARRIVWAVRAKQKRTYARRAKDRRSQLRKISPAFRAREAEYSRRYRAKRRLAREVGA